MKFFTTAICSFGFAAALAGQLSNVQNQRLQYDLAERLENRRLIVATLKRMPWYLRSSPIHGLRYTAYQLKANCIMPALRHENEVKWLTKRRNRFEKNHF